MGSAEDGERLEIAIVDQDGAAHARESDLDVFDDKLGGVRMDAPLDLFLSYWRFAGNCDASATKIYPGLFDLY